MRVKKRVIYGLSFLLFGLLIGLYGWSTAAANEQANRDRLAAAVATAQVGLGKSLEYLAKDALLGVSSCGLEDTGDPGAGEEHLRLCTRAHLDCYVVDSDGVLHRAGAPLDRKRLGRIALTAAAEKGYAAAGLIDSGTGQRMVAVLVPLNTAWEGYLAYVCPGDDFVTRVSENVGLPREYLSLFDEWGNPVGACRAPTRDDQLLEEVLAGAAEYSYSPQSGAVQRSGGAYRVYFSAGEPDGWFYGARVARLDGAAFLMSLPVSALVMLGILVLLLAVVVVLDVFNDRETQRKLAQVGHVDHLTGLVNGAGMQEAVTDFMQRHPMKGYSLVCLDIVAFSRVNTMFGYSVGDLLLRVIADVLQERYFCGVRNNADCFVFLAVTTQELTQEIENQLNRAIESRLGPEYLQMVAFKFGLYPMDGRAVNFREVYEGALLALKEAKKHNGQSEKVYDQRLQQDVELQKNIEVNMMHALSKEEFVVYVQPQISLPGETCARGEALIRWNSEFMGFMPPDKFIPVFEGNGFIVETDFFMLTEAMRMVSQRLAAGLSPVTLAVNQSKVTISFPNYYQRLQNLVEEFPNVPLKYIELEITESTLENNWGTIVPLIHSVKKMGFSVAMDDFGSGFSSLNTLRILPIDILKIDKEFLRASDGSERCRTIIRNVIRLARELEIGLVCEGVETEEQLAFLKENGCDLVQGYFYSKPIPMEEFVGKFLD